jgi:NADPH-dependent 2,4-dienoyl-CoA reductase/sulfur reductase-like enzyme
MRIVIAGAGLAAQRCAESLRANGHDGPITMIGAEEHRPYDRPPLSKAYLHGERPDVDLVRDDLDIELRTSTRATGLGDTTLHLVTGETLPFDRLLIATGAQPVALPALDNATNVHVLRTKDDAVRLDHALAGTSHIAIVGAGLIGQEVASAARARGIHATLIDAVPTPFDALMGPGGGHHLQELHERAGVELRLGRRLVAVRWTPGRVAALQLDDGTTVEPDLVLVAVGVRPATAWTPWPAGIPTDAAGKAPQADVYAAGDATGSAHWEAAVHQGRNAAFAMLGLAHKPEQPPLVWSDQHGVRIQRVGDPRGAQRTHDLTYARDGRLAAVVLMNRPGEVARARRRIKEAA